MLTVLLECIIDKLVPRTKHGCHVWSGRTIYGTIGGPPGHRWSPSRKSSRLIHDGPPCCILQSSVSCSHVSVRWLRLLHARGRYSSRYCFTRLNMPHACMDCLHVMYSYRYHYTPAYLQLPVYPCMHVHAVIMAIAI